MASPRGCPLSLPRGYCCLGGRSAVAALVPGLSLFSIIVPLWLPFSHGRSSYGYPLSLWSSPVGAPCASGCSPVISLCPGGRSVCFPFFDDRSLVAALFPVAVPPVAFPCLCGRPPWLPLSRRSSPVTVPSPSGRPPWL